MSCLSSFIVIAPIDRGRGGNDRYDDSRGRGGGGGGYRDDRYEDRGRECFTLLSQVCIGFPLLLSFQSS